MNALANANLVVGCFALYNGMQCFVPGMRVTDKIYANRKDQVTPLMCRMMGTWTLTSAMVRMYAAWHIYDPVVYQMCLWTYAIALGSFLTEVFIYRTAPLTSPGVFPALIVSTVMLAVMLSQQPAIQ